MEVFLSYPENNDILDEHLQKYEKDGAIVVSNIVKKNLKRNREQ
jgi:hypothetical protein